MVENIEAYSEWYPEEKCIAPYTVFATRKDSLEDAWYTHHTSESARHNECCYADEHTTDEGMKIERIHKV